MYTQTGARERSRYQHEEGLGEHNWKKMGLKKCLEMSFFIFLMMLNSDFCQV
jgi:hypothetical protein